jgi:hypothetical protein
MERLVAGHIPGGVRFRTFAWASLPVSHENRIGGGRDRPEDPHPGRTSPGLPPSCGSDPRPVTISKGY